MRLLALIGMVFAASSSLAENNPPRPFQEKGAEPIPLPFTVVTPQQRTDEIETWAKEHEQSEGEFLEQFSYLRFFWPDGVKEFTALARYSLLVLTVETQKSEDLPLKRVYLRTQDREIPLSKISSWRMNVDQKLIAYKRYGPYREDGFYLFPFSAILRIGQIQADFAADRSNYPVLDFPAYRVPGWLRNIQSPDPVPNALPDPVALERFIRRNTAGFPATDPLPAAAVPKPQGSEPKAPGALRELFKN